MLIKRKELSFSELIKNVKHPVIVIGRFLSLLELYKMNAVDFEQKVSLGELRVKWIAQDDFDPEARLQGSDFDTPADVGAEGAGSGTGAQSAGAGSGAVATTSATAEGTVNSNKEKER
jgi:hypothetical protein